ASPARRAARPLARRARPPSRSDSRVRNPHRSRSGDPAQAALLVHREHNPAHQLTTSPAIQLTSYPAHQLSGYPADRHYGVRPLPLVSSSAVSSSASSEYTPDAAPRQTVTMKSSRVASALSTRRSSTSPMRSCTSSSSKSWGTQSVACTTLET